MQIYIMDSDYDVLKTLDNLINHYPKCTAKCYTGPHTLVNAVKNEAPQAVIVDFDTQNSLSAVKAIKKEAPDTKIIMMSKNKDKAIELFQMGLQGFLLKPLSEAKIKEQLYCLQHPIFSKLTVMKEKNEAL